MGVVDFWVVIDGHRQVRLHLKGSKRVSCSSLETCPASLRDVMKMKPVCDKCIVKYS